MASWTFDQIMFVVSLISTIIVLFKILRKASSTVGNLFVYSLYFLLGVFILWGFYNQIGQKFHLWEPISADRFLLKIPILRDLVSKLNSILGGG